MHKRCWSLLSIAVASCMAGGCDEPPAANAPSVDTGAAASPPAPARGVQSPRTARRQIAFVQGYRAGIEAASTQKKPMLLFFTAEWCHYCHQLAAEAFTEEGVVSLSERFVCVLVDADREADVCRYFRVRTYPTIQFVSAGGEILNRMVGKWPGYEVARQMQAALQAVARSDDSDQVRR